MSDGALSREKGGTGTSPAGFDVRSQPFRAGPGFAAKMRPCSRGGRRLGCRLDAKARLAASADVLVVASLCDGSRERRWLATSHRDSAIDWKTAARARECTQEKGGCASLPVSASPQYWRVLAWEKGNLWHGDYNARESGCARQHLCSLQLVSTALSLRTAPDDGRSEHLVDSAAFLRSRLDQTCPVAQRRRPEGTEHRVHGDKRHVEVSRAHTSGARRVEPRSCCPTDRRTDSSRLQSHRASSGLARAPGGYYPGYLHGTWTFEGN